MKKFLSLIVVVVLVLAWSPMSYAALHTVSASENPAADATGGLDYDGGAWTVTVPTATNVGSTGGVSAQTATNNTGVLTLSGTTTVAGTIGQTGGRVLNAINAGAATKTATFSGNTSATTTTVTGTGTLAFSGNLTGTTLAFGANNGLVTFASGSTLAATTTSNAGVGSVTFGGANTVSNDLSFASNGLQTVTITTGAVTLGAGIDAKTTNLTLNDGSLTVTGGGDNDFTMLASGTLATTVSSGTSFGNVDLTAAAGTGSAIVPTTTTVAVTVSGYVANGSSLVIVNGTLGGGVAGANTVTSTSPNVTFTANSGVADDLTLTATRNNVATTDNASTVATVINGLGTPTGDMLTVMNAVDSLTGSADVNNALNQFDPIVNAGASAGSFNVTNQSLNALNQHLSEVGAGGTGVATGDFWKDNGIWVKGFGNQTNQGTREGINGYKANMWGVTGGMDGIIADNTRLGFSGGYASTSIDNKQDIAVDLGGRAGGTDIDSYQGTVYVGYDDPSPWYGNAGFTFGWNDYSGTRRIVFSSIDRTANSDYSGQQYTGFFDAGYVWAYQGMDVTPLGSLTYSHLALDKYTETGAGDLNLAVNSQSYDLLQSGLGLKVSKSYEIKSGKFVPEVHAKWLYDFIGDKASTTATFAGGGASFDTNGADPAQHSFNVGAGITLYTKGNITISGTYDFEAKSDFTSHTGQGVLRYNF